MKEHFIGCCSNGLDVVKLTCYELRKCSVSMHVFRSCIPGVVSYIFFCSCSGLTSIVLQDGNWHVNHTRICTCHNNIQVLHAYTHPACNFVLLSLLLSVALIYQSSIGTSVSSCTPGHIAIIRGRREPTTWMHFCKDLLLTSKSVGQV